VAGRQKDMFISGGENVYPVEIESVLYQHPAVSRCAVVGVPDARWGEVGHAFVVTQTPVEAEALRAFLAERIARYKLPKKIRMLAELPLTAAGKIERSRLREMAK
jgi:fatty-acyl-CoA synthase